MKKIVFCLILLVFTVKIHAQTEAIIISEVFYDSPLEEDLKGSPLDHHNGEFIEFFNPSSDAVDISGWSLKDEAQSYTFPDNTIIYSRNFLVLAFKHPSTDFEFSSLFPEVKSSYQNGSVLYQSRLWLNNKGEKISLYNSKGLLVDEMSYRNRITTEKKSNYWLIYAINKKK